MALEVYRARDGQLRGNRASRHGTTGEIEEAFARSLIDSSTKQRSYGMEPIGKNILPIFDGYILGSTSHSDGSPYNSIILFLLSITSRIIGISVAYSYSLSGEITRDGPRSECIKAGIAKSMNSSDRHL